MFSTNLTSVSTIDEEIPTVPIRWLLLLLALLPFQIIFSNYVVFHHLIRPKFIETIYSRTLLSLAVTDMMLGVVVLPLAIVKEMTNGLWVLGHFTCLMWITLDVLLCTASIIHLCAISINRYIAIAHPHQFRNTRPSRKQVVAIIAPAWIISAAISLNLLIQGLLDEHFVLQHIENVGPVCMIFDRNYATYSSVISFFFPLFIMIFMEVKSIVLLRRNAKMLRSGKKGIHRLIAQNVITANHLKRTAPSPTVAKSPVSRSPSVGNKSPVPQPGPLQENKIALTQRPCPVLASENVESTMHNQTDAAFVMVNSDSVRFHKESPNFDTNPVADDSGVQLEVTQLPGTAQAVVCAPVLNAAISPNVVATVLNVSSATLVGSPPVPAQRSISSSGFCEGPLTTGDHLANNSTALVIAGGMPSNALLKADESSDEVENDVTADNKDNWVVRPSQLFRQFSVEVDTSMQTSFGCFVTDTPAVADSENIISADEDLSTADAEELGIDEGPSSLCEMWGGDFLPLASPEHTTTFSLDDLQEEFFERLPSHFRKAMNSMEPIVEQQSSEAVQHLADESITSKLDVESTGNSPSLGHVRSRRPSFTFGRPFRPSILSKAIDIPFIENTSLTSTFEGSMENLQAMLIANRGASYGSHYRLAFFTRAECDSSDESAEINTPGRTTALDFLAEAVGRKPSLVANFSAVELDFSSASANSPLVTQLTTASKRLSSATSLSSDSDDGAIVLKNPAVLHKELSSVQFVEPSASNASDDGTLPVVSPLGGGQFEDQSIKASLSELLLCNSTERRSIDRSLGEKPDRTAPLVLPGLGVANKLTLPIALPQRSILKQASSPTLERCNSAASFNDDEPEFESVNKTLIVQVRASPSVMADDISLASSSSPIPSGTKQSHTSAQHAKHGQKCSSTSPVVSPLLNDNTTPGNYSRMSQLAQRLTQRLHCHRVGGAKTRRRRQSTTSTSSDTGSVHTVGDDNGPVTASSAGHFGRRRSITRTRDRLRAATYRWGERFKQKENTKEKRAERTLILVFVCFVAMWLPFFLCQLIFGLCSSCNVPDIAFQLSTWLGWASSGVNPCIYTLFNKDFRQSFKRILHIG